MSWLSGAFWRYVYPIFSTLIFGLVKIVPLSGNIGRWKKSRLGVIDKPPARSRSKDYNYLIFCPSLGEYEMVKLLITQLRLKHPKRYIELTFFSSSGYNAVVNKKEGSLNYVSYAPFDTNSAVTEFFRCRNINEVVIATLAIWPNFLAHLIRENIPYSFIGTHIKEKFTTKLFARTAAEFIKKAKFISVIDQPSFDILNKLSKNILLSGDPRNESIIHDLQNPPTKLEIIDHFKNRSHLLVLGSTHPKDEKIIFPILEQLINAGWKIIIAPHEVDRAKTLCAVLKRAVLFSDLSNHMDADMAVLDSIGLLKYAYLYADASYVGGGFSNAIHNIAEPILGGSPVLVGPKHKNSYLAKELSKSHHVKIVSNSGDFMTAANHYTDENHKKQYRDWNLSFIKKIDMINTLIISNL